MATYTIELRKICNIYGRENVESWFKNYELSDYLTTSQIQTIENSGLWNKEKLAKKIVDHYFMREIGFETPFLFKHYVESTMNEIMEEKLPLIYSNAIEYNPLINVDFTETFSSQATETGENSSSSSSSSQSSGTSSNNSSVNGSSLNVNSDTPQGQINKQSILTGQYASDTTATENSESSTSSNNDSVNSSSSGTSSLNSDVSKDENYTKHIVGNSGVSATSQAMIKQYRENIVAIDKQIINELNSLFMGLY